MFNNPAIRQFDKEEQQLAFHVWLLRCFLDELEADERQREQAISNPVERENVHA